MTVISRSDRSRTDASSVYDRTGRADIEDLAAMIGENIRLNDLQVPPAGSRCGLDMSHMLAITLMLLRPNLTEQAVADMWDVSQPQACVIKTFIEELISMALWFIGITLSEAATTRPLIVDGTFVPTDNRKATDRANCSGKRDCQCLSIQVACDLQGRLIATSRPVPGSRHDDAALNLTGWDQILVEATWTAGSAYCATNASTPMKKPPGKELTPGQKECNKSLSHLRSGAEHANATLKQWKILSTGHRRRLRELPLPIALITKLELFRQGW